MVQPFDRLIDDHGEVVMRTCRAVLGAQDAEDAWADTFLAALEAYPDLRDERNLRGWLVTIAHRKAIDHLRRGARRAVPVHPLPDAAALDGEPRLADAHLWEALWALPERQRMALAYHHLAGLPYAAIAGLLGTSEAAARRAAADGMKKLRSTYRTEEP